MQRATSAAALSAAALFLVAAASPSIAQRADAAPFPSLSDQRIGILSTESSQAGDVRGPAIGVGDVQAPVVRPAIAPAAPQDPFASTPGDDEASEHPARNLADLVADYATADTPDEETDCLARAVYWESKGEPLNGQLAVANVIINRAHSGRFASTICGVVRQRSQFSFVRGGYIPAAPQGSRSWRTAVAIALIATRDLAGDAAPQALFFHARSVHPGWRLTRVASVGNHIFYR
jgi:N-acetylmuramoyl-L-alanine amidase